MKVLDKIQDVFIPSAGRAKDIGDIIQSFWKAGCNIKIITPKEDHRQYHSIYGSMCTVMVQPEGKLPEAQQFCIKMAKQMGVKKMILCDDDFRLFQKESQTAPLKETSNFNQMVHDLSRALDFVPVSGLSGRLHNNRATFPFTDVKPMYTLQAFLVKDIIDNDIRFDRLETLNDVDFLLQLFSKGMKNRVWTKYVAGSKPSLPGGCSRYRDSTTFARSYRALEEFHGDLVKVRDPTIRRICGENLDIFKLTVFWKKAYELGLESNP